MSNVATSLFSWDSMVGVSSTSSVDALGNATSSFFMYYHCLLTLEHARSLILPLYFSFKNMRDAIADACFPLVKLLVSIVMDVYISCIWVSSFVIAYYYYSYSWPVSVSWKRAYSRVVVFHTLHRVQRDTRLCPCLTVWYILYPMY